MGQPSDPQPAETMDLETFLQTVDLPDNLSVSFDPAQVKSVPSARTYKADFLTFDPDTVAKRLLRKEIADTRVMAEGPWYQAGDESLTEYLTVFADHRRHPRDQRSLAMGKRNGNRPVHKFDEVYNRKRYIRQGWRDPYLCQ